MLKIADQKYISDCRIDKNGEAYWKFKEVEESKLTSPEPIPSPNSNSIEKEGVHSELSQLDPITKFQKRQAKTEQLNQNHEPAATINTEQSAPTSQ